MSKNILVVDDDPVFRSSLIRLLKEKGFVTVSAKDGKEALMALDVYKGAIDGAIIDLSLPEIGGFQVIGELTKPGGDRPFPLLVVTGVYKDVYLEVAEYLGADRSMRKPSPGEPLTPVVDAFLGLVDQGWREKTKPSQ